MKTRLLLAFLLSIVAGLQSMKAQEAYACYTPENTTLTFYYDTQRDSRTGTTYDLNTGTYNTDWETDGTSANVTKVAFDATFVNARPTTTDSWFYNMKQLQTITGMEYLNTSEVTNMSWMFADCRALTDLDLSNFNTSKVTKMNCTFFYCKQLSTIYVGNEWNTAAVTSSDNMFSYCDRLVGGQGTTYDAEHVDASYAHIDGGTSNPGYLSSRPWDFMVDGIYYKFLGSNLVAVTYKNENYFSYEGDVVIPDVVEHDGWWYTVSSIGEKAFYLCPYLQNLTIPASVDRIEVEAFCDAFLDAINSTVTCLAQTPPSISPMSFDSAIEGMTLYVPVGTMTAYRSHSVWGQFASIVELPYSFVVNGIYYKITGDGTVSVTYRGANYNCYSGNVVIPATVTSDGVTYTVTAIEASAFFNCADLTDITIPETVTQIGFNAFQGCTALEEGNITCLAATPPTIQSNTFGTWHYKGASLYVPYGCYDAYASANYWKNFSDIYELEELIEYSLWIAGTQVTSWNKGNVLGDGHVSYDAGTNTLTLNGADISSESDYGIKSQTAGLNINVQGQNTVTVGSADGIYLHAGTATICGSGSLDVSSRAAVGIHAYQNLVLKDGVKVTVNSKSSYGVRGTRPKRTSPLPTLTLQGQETMLTAKGGNTSSSVAFFHALTLSDGLEILEPEGAEFLEDVGIVNSGGTVATFSKVVIGYPVPEPEAYACYTPENTTLTFYCDNLRSSRTGTTYDLNTGYDAPAWYDDDTRNNVTKVVFDASFADARPTTTYAWFAQMENLQSIEGMEYLNTSEVTYMGFMFYYCPSLTSLDVSHFNTSNVTDMYSMFTDCKSLTSLDLSSFNTSKVINMFAMFYDCKSLTGLDLSSFNTSKVTIMKYMFGICRSLKTIYVGSGWSTAAVTDSEDMFYGCDELVGGQGTTYDENHIDASYAHIDGGTSNPGYFTAEGAEPWSEPEAYACYTPDNTTLTFYCDNLRSSRTGTTYDLNTGENAPDWYNGETNASVTKVVFDASFTNARPTTTFAWFYEMRNLQTITGMEYLNTSEVKYMDFMFAYCESLASLDVSSFNTAKVISMYAMFYDCPSLLSLDMSNFNTSNVTDMSYMFTYCTSLTSLDLSSFNTSKVTIMKYMFGICGSLKTIYVGSGWSTAAVTNSVEMFYGCSRLVGGQGTVVDEDHIDASYAHIDGGTSNPGYFTAEGAEPWSGPEAYACYTPGNTTLTFFYDTQRDSRTGTTYSLNMGSYGPGWYNGETNASVTKVVFDASFANVRPTSTTSWFEGMENLQSIVGMEYLYTSEVKYMDFMFADCTSLTSLDISHFNTDKVTRMDGMFYGCEKFTSLNLSHFNTSNVTDMSWMFTDCESLTSLDVSSFNTGKVTKMSYMFRGNALTSLDLSNFNTANVTTMEDMFSDCSALTSLDLSNFNTGKVTNMHAMFWGCGALTTLDVSSFNTANVTDMGLMFASCRALKNLNLSNFNTANVTKMNRMFDHCTGLTTLDLSSFNTANVTDMGWMFMGCYSLKTIYVGDSWSTAAVTDSDLMFSYCTSLVGGQGTTYDADHVDASYAHIDGGTSNPGYFTAEGAEPGPEAYACYTPENTTLTFYFDNQHDSRTGTTYDLNTEWYQPTWYRDNTNANVTQVVFDSSFANARPTTTYLWFYGMEQLQTITGMEYLNTSEVTIMTNMFEGCKSLTSLDVSHFNTANVTTMAAMFKDCEKLTSLDLSNFNTGKVTNLNFMFKSCEALTSLDLSNFNTANATEMEGMFDYCYGLTSLDVSSFNTANVTYMAQMFDFCSSLTSLDVSSFNTANVTYMSKMFGNCTNLKTIYVGDGWSTAAVTDSELMFLNCNNLVGGAGTTYDENHIDASYAHIDGGTSNPGYFTGVATYELWIAGTQVTSANMNDVLGDGTVSYDLSTNTLTLNNANISANGTRGIRAVFSYFKIKLLGSNKVEVVDGQGVSATNRDGGTVTIFGGGSLSIKSSDVAFATNCELVLQDGVTIRAESTGSYGIEGSKARAARFYPAITMAGNETVLMAKGSTGAITHFRIMNMNDGIAVIEPLGATFVSNDGILAMNEWVVIANRDYIDGISLTPALSSREGEWYDLQGRKVMNPRKGIYIKDGKKVLIK